MANNKLSDLNDHLFCQLERLNEDKMSDEDVQREVSKSKAISQVSQQIIQNAKLTLEAVRLASNADLDGRLLPSFLDQKKIEQTPESKKQ